MHDYLINIEQHRATANAQSPLTAYNRCRHLVVTRKLFRPIHFTVPWKAEVWLDQDTAIYSQCQFQNLKPRPMTCRLTLEDFSRTSIPSVFSHLLLHCFVWNIQVASCRIMLSEYPAVNRKGGNCDALQLEGVVAPVVLGINYEAHNALRTKSQHKWAIRSWIIDDLANFHRKWYFGNPRVTVFWPNLQAYYTSAETGFGKRSDIATRFSDSDFLKDSNNSAISRRFRVFSNRKSAIFIFST